MNKKKKILAERFLRVATGEKILLLGEGGYCLKMLGGKEPSTARCKLIKGGA